MVLSSIKEAIVMKKNLLLVVSFFCTLLLHAQSDDQAIAIQLVQKEKAAIGLSDADMNNFSVSNTYFDKTAGIRLVYLQQSFKDIPVYNQLLVLGFKNNQLVSKSGGFISSIAKRTNSVSGTPSISPEQAVYAALNDRKLNALNPLMVLKSDADGKKIMFDHAGISRENITVDLMWVPVEDGRKVVLSWQVYIIPVSSDDYWLVRVNAIDKSIAGVSNLTVYCNWDDPAHANHTTDTHSGKAALKAAVSSSIFDFTTIHRTSELNSSPTLINSASYRVIPFPAESPNHPGGAAALKTDPWTLAPGNATSLKWHNNGTIDFNYTRGNNVWAQEDRNGNNGTGTPATSTTPDPLTFNFVPNFTVSPIQTTPVQNQQFNTTNLFYWNNIIHDLTYQYGFDEVAGNFQASNQGRGGLGNDYVFADAQDGGGTNNANFSTPPDGGNGRMQMYLWNGTPQKDGDVDNGIISHEFAHGISNRLTGGPAQAGCLGNAEQMGEGWSDYYGLMYTQDWANSTLNTGFNSPRGIGTYAVGQTATGLGIRSQKYCTNFAVNNKVYGATISAQQHNRGEIWCATLWDMTWNIINQVGSINPNIFDANGTGGNVIALKLVTEGMKLQPCSPGFIDGRDGILQADQILYGGAHSCAIREAFRKRGMGALASQGSSGSTTDQIPDYSSGSATLQLTQNITQVPEGQNITYTNRVTVGECGGISNFTITDTLPTNVTYVSGGTYNSSNRVVSFPVTLGAGQTQDYIFTVQVNNGAYFPTVSLFEDTVLGPSIPAGTWTPSTTTTTNWVVSNARSFSAPNSYFAANPDIQSDQNLTLTNTINLGTNPPPLSFRHWFSTETQYDGGVLEISSNGGAWTDVLPLIIAGGYTATMDATTIIPGRRAWSGSSNNKFIKTKINLATYANQNVKFRFRYTTDVGTNLEGWYVDDIAIKNQALVEITSNLYTASNVNVAQSDTFTIILPATTCTGATITTQPSNVTACAGGSATFNTVIAGTNPVYQWQLSTDGGASYNNISGANSSSLTIPNVTVAFNNYRYRVQVSNACPSSATSDAAVLNVTSPAVIATQPVSQVLCSGGNASFTVVTTGTASSYQWQVSTDGGATFSDIAAQTSPTLSLTNVAASQNNYQYHVVIGSCGPNALVSSNVTLTVNSEASILAQPSNTSACAGSNASFTTTANGTTLTYQWQVSTDGGVTYTDIPGATSATLDLTAVTASMNNNSYRVRISSSSCPATVTSSSALLIVNNNAIITSQPTANSTCPGSNTLFTVTASGTGLTYQWQVSTNGGTTFSDISGETSASLNINNVLSTMNGNLYRCVITSACSSTGINSNAVVLDVLSASAINAQPLNFSGCVNSSATFSATATGNALTYQWQVSTDGGSTYNDIPGATLTSFTIAAISASQNNNRYRLVATGVPCGAAISDPALLLVSTPASITQQPGDVTACASSNTSITVSANGTNLIYQWEESADGGTTFTDVNGATTNTLFLSNVAIGTNNRQYRARISAPGCGTIISGTAILSVNPTPVVNVVATPSSVVLPGQTITLTASATPAASTYNWSYNNNSIPGANGSSITVDGNGLGNYIATVVDANGCSGSSSALTVRDTVLNYTFIYPNPNNGEFQVRWDGVPVNGQPRLITMYDAKGARVYQKAYTITSAYQIMDVKVKFLSKGVYAVVLTDASGNKLATGKVVIR